MKETAFVPTRAPGRGRIEFGHVALITANLDAMVAWYKTVFDMDVVFQSERRAFLTFDDVHHRLVIAQPGRGAAPEPAPQRVDHIAFRCTDHDHLVRWYRTLGHAAIEPLRATNHGIITSIYYADPDGNKIEFYADNFPTVGALNDWFATGAFDRDQIGIAIDFEAMATRLLDGESAELLFAPPQQ
jgi:catechol-2,3-dioxygenase